MSKALIVSDAKAGHLGQSRAFCRLLGLESEELEVRFPARWRKGLSYVLDRLGVYRDEPFSLSRVPHRGEDFIFVVSAGSSTYYANKVLARRLGARSVAILYPRGLRLDFDHLLIPAYDHPPRSPGVVELPVSLAVADEAFYRQESERFLQTHTPHKPAVGVVIGGPNAVSRIDPGNLRGQLEAVFAQSSDREHWVSTSRRTPPEVEAVVESFPFEYRLIASREPGNPLPAFIALCERLFVTGDSASMLSECVSYGTASVEVLPTVSTRKGNKFERFVDGLEARGAVHRFDGTLGRAREKIDLRALLRSAIPL